MSSFVYWVYALVVTQVAVTPMEVSPVKPAKKGLDFSVILYNILFYVLRISDEWKVMCLD